VFLATKGANGKLLANSRIATQYRAKGNLWCQSTHMETKIAITREVWSRPRTREEAIPAQLGLQSVSAITSSQHYHATTIGVLSKIILRIDEWRSTIVLYHIENSPIVISRVDFDAKNSTMVIYLVDFNNDVPKVHARRHLRLHRRQRHDATAGGVF